MLRPASARHQNPPPLPLGPVSNARSFTMIAMILHSETRPGALNRRTVGRAAM